jgi:tRNA C32,U32 (ribose-2'-O)-methylase TrmJ
MANPNIRSLNLAMTAGIVLYEALRQKSEDRGQKTEKNRIQDRGVKCLK